MARHAASTPEVSLSRISVMGGAAQMLLAWQLSQARKTAPLIDFEQPQEAAAYQSPISAFNRLTQIATGVDTRNMLAHIVRVGRTPRGVAVAQPALPQPNLTEAEYGVRLSWWLGGGYSGMEAFSIGANLVSKLVDSTRLRFGNDAQLWSVALPADGPKPDILWGARFTETGYPTQYVLGDGAIDQEARRLWVSRRVDEQYPA